MQLWQLLLILVAILPLFYKYSFWFYTIQLKEYRWDRFKEYIFTPQWKSAILNFWFFIELPVLIFSIMIFIDKNLIYLIHPVVFYFLVFVNIFVIWKIFRWRILKPKITWRLLITLVFLLIWFVIDFYFILFAWYWNAIYAYILASLLFAPLIIFFYILLTLPLVNFLKNRKINKAINKSKKIDKPVKIAITWSYWKSSVKEFLSSILEKDWELLKTPENINTELWVSALILNKLKNSYKYFIAEIWAYRIWEISTLWKIVNHKYWFLTAIWNQHIWLFWSQENIVKGKFEIFEKVKENNWILYVNWDSPHLTSPLGERDNRNNIILYWIDWEDLDAKSEILEIENLKTKFKFIYKDINEIFETNLIWKHNILNLTWILAFSYNIWLKTKDLKKYLLNIKSPKNTWEIIEKDNIILIDDTYNLSEAGLKSWIDLLKFFKNKEKNLVLDDILELWKDSEKIHFEIAKKIWEEKLVDKVLYCGVNYKKSFIDWLIKWWFKQEDILSTKGFNPLKKSVILFEGKKAKNYLNKVLKAK